MRVLYVASAVEAGDTSGGSTHVSEVACGLAALGHKVLVVARPASPEPVSKLECGVPVRASQWRKELALLGLLQVARAFRSFKPDVVMERFYNFAGAGVLLAHRRGIPSLLEVNAPMIDPPGSLKSKVDRLLLGSMRRWAVRQAKWSAAIVTPLATTVPPEVGRRKIVELPWGANVERFDPTINSERAGRLEELAAGLGLERGVPVVAFLGSFRAWHGVGHFAEAARRVLASRREVAFLAIGGGPELEPLRERVAELDLPPGRFVFAGPQPHERVPELLALADVGVAPFDLAAHPPLTTFGFYWSPLKVFEYMSMGLPVVTIDVTPLNEIARHEREGLLYRPGDMSGLVGAIERLASDGELRRKLGTAGRSRVIEKYSWQAHCVALDSLLRKITHAR
ncbi:MAG TPA: glycosyltransferase family 4 protein [Chloroflexia bacterium]|nr:glycosyltransferase family 4 protein [Chloroflexia bacterium]